MDCDTIDDDDDDDVKGCPKGETPVKSGNKRCSCLRVKNFWLKGVEGLVLNALPSYGHSDIIAEHNTQDFRTTVLDAEGNVAYVFEPMEEVRLTVDDILALVNVSLDDTNEVAESTFFSRNGSDYEDDSQPYRMTGVSVELALSFEGIVRGRLDDSVNLVVHPRHRGGGYVSQGSRVVYREYPVYNCSKEETGTDDCVPYGEVLVDRFLRGVRIVITTSGTIYGFDFFNLIKSLTSFIVLLGLSTTIMTFVAMFGMGHASKVYEAERAADVSVKRAHAKVGAQAILAAICYDNMPQNRGPDGAPSGVPRSHLIAILEAKGLAHDEAATLVDAVLEEGDEDNAGDLDYKEWVGLVTDDTVDLDAIVETRRKAADAKARRELRKRGKGGDDPPAPAGTSFTTVEVDRGPTVGGTGNGHPSVPGSRTLSHASSGSALLRNVNMGHAPAAAQELSRVDTSDESRRV